MITHSLLSIAAQPKPQRRTPPPSLTTTASAALTFLRARAMQSRGRRPFPGLTYLVRYVLHK